MTIIIDDQKGLQIIAIHKAVNRARKKHPNFGKNIHEAYTVLCSEVGEIGTAILRETPERVIEEIDDTIAVLIRMREGDHLKNKCNF